MTLHLASLSKIYLTQRAVEAFSLTLAPGETLCLLGPSGCGKSTLLNLIAGLETPDAGTISWEGQDLARVPAHRRGFSLMFQDYALFPHRNVFENVAFGLQMQGQARAEIATTVGRVLQWVKLMGFEGRDVNTLSGGEAQRVALARALAPRPRLLLLDEPLGALDRVLREELLDDLRALLRTNPDGARQTTLYVTHDQQEAFALADRIGVMRAGRLLQVATPEELYAHPTSPFVARFLGLTNFVEATPLSALAYQTPFGVIQLTASSSSAPRSPLLLIHPDAARLAGQLNPLTVRVVARSFRGSLVRLTVQPVAGPELVFDFSPQTLPNVGEQCVLYLDPERLTLVENESDPFNIANSI